MIEVKVEGLRELNAAMKALPREISEKLLDRALGRGATVIRAEAKLRAPKAANAHFRARGLKTPPGVLKNAVYAVRVKELGSFFNKVWRVGVRKGRKLQKSERDAFYWWWVENGHAIVPRRATKAVSMRSHRHLVGSKGRVPAYPFLRPAFESKQQAAFEAIRAYLEREIPKAAVKVAGSRGRA